MSKSGVWCCLGSRRAAPTQKKLPRDSFARTEKSSESVCGSIAMIEHKAGEPRQLVALLERLDLVDDVLVQSFDWTWLEKIHGLAPRLTIAALSDKSIGRPLLDGLGRTGAAIAHWSADRLENSDVRELRRRGYLVGAYTLNSDLELLGAAAIGLDLVTTNRPARMLTLQSEGALKRR